MTIHHKSQKREEDICKCRGHTGELRVKVLKSRWKKKEKQKDRAELEPEDIGPASLNTYWWLQEMWSVWATSGGFRTCATKMEEVNIKALKLDLKLSSQISIQGNKSGTRRRLSGAIQFLGCSVWDPSVPPGDLTGSVHPGGIHHLLEEDLSSGARWEDVCLWQQMMPLETLWNCPLYQIIWQTLWNFSNRICLPGV